MIICGICIWLPKLDMLKRHRKLWQKPMCNAHCAYLQRKMNPGWKFKRLIFNKISHAEEIRIWHPKLKWNKNGTFDKWFPASLFYLKGICIWLPKLGFKRKKYITWRS